MHRPSRGFCRIPTMQAGFVTAGQPGTDSWPWRIATSSTTVTSTWPVIIILPICSTRTVRQPSALWPTGISEANEDYGVASLRTSAHCELYGAAGAYTDY